MKNKLIITTILCSTLLAVSPVAAAIDIQNLSQSQTKSSLIQVLKKLDDAGYKQINEIKIEGDRYKIETFSNSGIKIKFYVDNNGKGIPSIEKTQNMMTMLQATKKLLDKGYDKINIYKIEIDDNGYEVEAIQDGKKIELHIDPISGKVTNNNLKSNNND